MSDGKSHLEKALHNESFYDSTANSEYLDWAVTGLFYAALQYVDAYLSTKGIHPTNHGNRTPLVSNEHDLKIVCVDYLTLKDESEAGRYRLKRFTSSDLTQINNSYQHLKGYISKLLS